MANWKHQSQNVFFSRAIPQSQNSEQTDLLLHCHGSVISIGSISVFIDDKQVA